MSVSSSVEDQEELRPPPAAVAVEIGALWGVEALFPALGMVIMKKKKGSETE
jgi:hypothetical protein